jgi:hypothetical protein
MGRIEKGGWQELNIAKGLPVRFFENLLPRSFFFQKGKTLESKFLIPILESKIFKSKEFRKFHKEKKLIESSRSQILLIKI